MLKGVPASIGDLVVVAAVVRRCGGEVFRVNRRVDSNTGDITSDFQYTDVGVKLEALPVINMHDEVTLKLTLEVSALGENLSADPNDPNDPNEVMAGQVMSMVVREMREMIDSADTLPSLSSTCSMVGRLPPV